MNRFKIVLGDWSDDGHGKYEHYIIQANKPVNEVQEAYKKSCQLTGVSFNDSGNDYTGRNYTHEEQEKFHVCTNYEQNVISKEVVEVFRSWNCPFELQDGYVEDIDEFVQLLLWFISLSLPDLKTEFIDDVIPVFNGYWDENLNVQIGYGLFYS